MNEEKKDFNAMLHNSKDMPKIKTIDKEEVVSRYGGRKMLLAPPIDYDKVIKRIPHGKLLTIERIRNILPINMMQTSLVLLQQVFSPA